MPGQPDRARRNAARLARVGRRARDTARTVKYLRSPATVAGVWRVSARLHARRLGRRSRLLRRPIRIAFLAQDPLDWWSVHSLYEACREDRRFDAHVISIGWGPWLDMWSDCRSLFARLGIVAIDGRAEPTALAELAPDVLVISSPYDAFRDRAWHTDKLLCGAKLLYIPYGIDISVGEGELGAAWFQHPVQRRAWRIAAGSPARIGQWLDHTGIARRRILGLGLPVVDQTHEPSAPDPLPPEALRDGEGRLRILYTPHHTVRVWSTFLERGPALRRLVAEDDRLCMIFRPHPGLGPTLADLELMPEDEFAAWTAPPRIHADSGESFFSVLAWADVIVTDASSMLFHFAPTGKPIVYLPLEGGAGLDPLSQEYVSHATYVAGSDEDLAGVLWGLAEGIDPLADERRAANREGVALTMTAGAGTRLCRHLAEVLG